VATSRSRVLLWIAGIFAVLSMIEFVVSMMFQSDTAVVMADGAHNLVDALSLAAAYGAEKVLGDRRKFIAFVLGAMGPMAYGIGLLLHSGSRGAGTVGVSARETVLLILLGAISLAVNMGCHRLTSGHGHAGLSAHLLADGVGAAAIVVTALMAPFTHRADAFIAITAFNIMVYVAWKELKPLARPALVRLPESARLILAHEQTEEAHPTNHHVFARLQAVLRHAQEDMADIGKGLAALQPTATAARFTRERGS
jgi:Co/Zn/Cd efflux system component